MKPRRQAIAPQHFTIIIPTRNRAVLLETALRSVQGLQEPGNVQVEVLVVDNGSSDDTQRVALSSEGPFEVRVVVEENQGLNHARNRGAVEASGDFLVYLDDDMEVAPEWLQACHDALARFPADAVCGPVFPKFEAEPPSWLTPLLSDSVTSAYSRKGEETELLDKEQGHELPGCNFGVWKDSTLAIGGFHPGLDRSGRGMLAGGDSEFGTRLIRNGGATLYVHECSIRHLVSCQKVSFIGMAKRWHGTGRTVRAREKIQGQGIEFKELLGRARDSLSFGLKSVLYAVQGQKGRAAESLMLSLRQVGYLSCMKTFQPSDRLTETNLSSRYRSGQGA